MRIVRIEVIPIALPFRERYRTASGELSARSMVVVRVHTDTGLSGIGEAVPLSLRGGPGLGQITSELAACGPALAGAVLQLQTPAQIRTWIWELLERCRRQHVCAQVISALDIALHDLAGRAGGMPMWRLLGAASPHGIDCNATLDAGEPARIAELAAAQLAVGYRTFKVKVGTGDDEARVAAVRGTVGEAPRLRIDANGAWSGVEATAKLRALQPFGIELAEQPCAEIAELAAVRARVPMPVIADESVSSPAEAEGVLRARAADATTIKLAKVGGPLEALRIAAILPSYLSSALDGPIGIAAAVHTAQALPQGGFAGELAHGLATLAMFSAVYADPSELLAPVLTPRRAAGLGVEVDDAVLQEFRL
jgi:muconate cycloisomerase